MSNKNSNTTANTDTATSAENKELAEIRQMLDSQAKELSQIKKENKILTEKLEQATIGSDANPQEKKEPLIIPKENFEVDGKKYCFVVPRFHLPQNEKGESLSVTAKDALQDPEILQGLVARKSGVIKEVV